MEQALSLYGQRFSSRLLLGSAGYASAQVLQQILAERQPAMVTVALRRQNTHSSQDGQSFFELIRQTGIPVLPNTAGCQTVKEAIATAHMARELFGTPWIKLELIGDDDTLQPDVFGLVAAAEALVRDGFYVLPYCTEDLIACRRLLDVGCQALMPWAAPIGTALGVVHEYALRVLRERLPDVALIIDAGLGLPSQAAAVMEWGYDGVLLNSAVALSADARAMAAAFDMAIKAGRLAYQSGPLAPRTYARASTPIVGRPFWHSAEYE